MVLYRMTGMSEILPARGRQRATQCRKRKIRKKKSPSQKKKERLREAKREARKAHPQDKKRKSRRMDRPKKRMTSPHPNRRRAIRNRMANPQGVRMPIKGESNRRRSKENEEKENAIFNRLAVR